MNALDSSPVKNLSILENASENINFKFQLQISTNILFLFSVETYVKARLLLLLERLSMTFTADGKRQRLPLIFYSFLVILK